MFQKSLKILAILLLSGFAFTTIQAHPKGNDKRNANQCKTLKKKKLIDNCMACVARPNPHHFHPNNAPGKRCRPNDGKP